MAVPLAPVNVTISELKTTSVKVSAQQGQSGLTSRFFYVVRTNGTGGKFVDATFVSGNIFSAVITGLTADDQYRVSAGVFNADGQSPYSDDVVFTTYLAYGVPPAPPSPTVWNITATGMQADQPPNSPYGRPASVEWEIRVRKVGESAYASQVYSTAGAIRTFSTLTRNTQYVAYGRSRNEVGWSDFSSFTYFTTSPTVPDQPSTPLYANVAQNSVEISFSDPNDGGSSILERQIYWGTTTTPTGNATASDGNTNVTNLVPAGGTIYFRVRVRNAMGWSEYSPARSVKLIAGAWVKYNNAWKEAVPWVKHNGVWKVAKPWVRIMGVWKGVK